MAGVYTVYLGSVVTCWQEAELMFLISSRQVFEWVLRRSRLLQNQVSIHDLSDLDKKRGRSERITLVLMTVTAHGRLSAARRGSHIAPFPGCTWTWASGRIWEAAVSCTHFLVEQRAVTPGRRGGRGGSESDLCKNGWIMVFSKQDARACSPCVA